MIFKRRCMLLSGFVILYVLFSVIKIQHVCHENQDLGLANALAEQLGLSHRHLDLKLLKEVISQDHDPTTNGAKNKFPIFTLDKTITAALQTYLDSNMKDHIGKKALIPVLESLIIHKGSDNQLKPWQIWQNSINQYELYDGQDHITDIVLQDLLTLPIIGMKNMEDYGTGLKVLFNLSDGSQALFKPMRFNRYKERDINHTNLYDFERHHGEIGAFHLDRIMGFNRVPPAVGRFVNITDTLEKYAEKSFKETIFLSSTGNKCFYGTCKFYCDTDHAICGSPDMVEGSMASWIPFKNGLGEAIWGNPLRSHHRPGWKLNNSVCENIKKTTLYNTGRWFLDLMDVTIFDYLTGNHDRHSYYTFKTYGNNTFIILVDNGLAFGLMYIDDPSILRPLEQCCQIRYSTLHKLLGYESREEKLSDKVRHSIMRDPLSSGPNGPLLNDGHLKSLDRRVSKVLDVVWTCVNKYGYEQTILDDGL